MKRTRHTPEQIVAKLREADAMLAAGKPAAIIVQALGVSEQTYTRWRQQFGGMQQGEARRLRELEVENARLKKAVATLTGVEHLYIAPGAPWESGFAESFHLRLRDELLNAGEFLDLREAKALAARWRDEYNHRRPHSSLGYVPPAVFAAGLPAAPAGPPVGAPPLPPARPASIPTLEPRLS